DSCLSCSGQTCSASRSLDSFPTRRSSDLAGPLLRQANHAGAGELQRFAAERVKIVEVAIPHHPDRARNQLVIHEFPRRSQSSQRSEEHTSELQSRFDLVCRLLLEKKNRKE